MTAYVIGIKEVLILPLNICLISGFCCGRNTILIQLPIVDELGVRLKA